MKNNRKIFTLLFLISLHFSLLGQSVPVMRTDDKLRIREAINICQNSGNQIWEGINKTAFAIILLTDSVEFLVYHPNPSDDFLLSERDTILQTNILYRKRIFPKNLLATFPAVNGVSCIVMGTPENTRKNSTEWIITLLHEHFHQYQHGSPDYFPAVDRLDLTGGDKTGMWMLNYSFPYNDNLIANQYEKYTNALSRTLLAIDTKKFRNDFNKFRKERKKIQQLLTLADYRYFSLQIWQEGLARYTEYKFLASLSDYKPSKEVTMLSDFISFRDYKQKFFESETHLLTKLNLEESKRVCFYSAGFAEGLLLDKLNPAWHSQYFSDKFFIEKYSKRFK